MAFNVCLKTPNAGNNFNFSNIVNNVENSNEINKSIPLHKAKVKLKVISH